MPQLPERPRPNAPIPAGWFQQFYDYVAGLDPATAGTSRPTPRAGSATYPPFLGGIYDGSTVKVGALRETTGYPHNDTITIRAIDGTVTEVAKTTAETLSSITETSWVYYLVAGSGSTWDATLTAAAALPSTLESSQYLVIVGLAIVSDGGSLAGWRQYLTTCPVIDELAPAFDLGAIPFWGSIEDGTLSINAGNVYTYQDGATGVAGYSAAVQASRYYWVEIGITAVTGAILVTGTIQDGATAPDYFEADAVNILIGQTDGDSLWTQKWAGGHIYAADVLPKNSIEIDTGNYQLVGDEATPGNHELYGTDAAGDKGWQPTTQITVLTALRHDSGDIQYKTRTVQALAAGTESGWATAATIEAMLQALADYNAAAVQVTENNASTIHWADTDQCTTTTTTT